MEIFKGFLGTYASSESLGIYQFTFHSETGALSIPELYYKAADSKYLSLYNEILASPIRQDNKAGICLLNTGTGGTRTGSAFYESAPACYVIQDDHFIYTANYHEGSILIYSKEGGVPELVKRLETAPKAGCHQIILYKHFLMVPCLLLDKIMFFDCSRDFEPAGELLFSKGTGPRHGIFDKEQKRFFLVSELSNELYIYRILENMDFLLEQVCPLLSNDMVYQEKPASAAVRLSQDERFLYISTRFAELILVFQVEGCHVSCIQQTNCEGRHPRDLILTPDGNHLLAVNKTEGGLVSFRLDKESGMIIKVCSKVPAPEAVCVVFEKESI